MYEVRLLDSAIDDLEKLDKVVAKRIVEKLKWLSKNFNLITPQPLKGNLAGFYKLRVGNYRIIYQVLEDEKLIIVHAIGHRNNIYRVC